MDPIRVPKTPARSFDKNRPPSELLLKQIEHLQWAALPASERDQKQMKAQRKPTTEGQAAKRIERLTAQILSPAGQPAGTTPPAARKRTPRKPGKRARRRRS
jgi:hypothetical protein